MDPQPLPSSWVQPAAPLRPRLIKLSALDNLTAPVYPSPTHFFPLKPGVDPKQIYEDCRRGLARYIYQHPHLPGTFVKDETGRNSIQIHPAPYAGVKFEFCDHRDATDMPSFEEFEKFGWPFADGDQDGLSKLRPKNFPTAQDGDPVLAPQFNVIRGGIVLTMSIAHAMCDLVQCMDFVGSWARHTCAVANARIMNLPEPPLPEQMAATLTDRSPLTPDVPIEPSIDKLVARAARFTNWTLIDPRDPGKMRDTLDCIFTKARLTDGDLANSTEDELRTLSTSVWTFPHSSMKHLNLIAERASLEGTKLSSIDCLTAFTWLRFFMAKWAPGKPGADPAPTSSRIVYAGSVRHRLASPMPSSYLPTCVDLFPVTASSSDLTPATPAALVNVARMIRSSNQAWSEEVFRELLEISQMHPMSPGLVPSGPLDTLVTDHTRGRTNMLEDWGPDLGQCVAFREPYLGRVPPLGEITLQTRWDNGDVDVMFAGEAVVMQRLLNDKDMKAMASCRFVMDDFPRVAAKSRRAAKL